MSLDQTDTTPQDGLERPAPPANRAARDRRQGRGLPVTIAAVAVGVFGASLWYAYYQGTQNAPGGEPPLVKADARPTKMKPAEPGGMKVPNQDKLVYQRMLASQPGKRVERLLPTPEAPLAKPGTTARGEAGVVAVGTTKVVPPKQTEPRKPPPKRATTLTIKTKPAVKPAPAATTAAAKPVKAPLPLAGRRYGVQLASLRKADGATGEWKRLVRAHAAVLEGLTSRVIRSDLGDKGVYYRLIAGPFKDDIVARAACRKLQAKKQGCLVVAYD
ncbi:MAG: SPOR domain-containing protein [Alphaproteobacteria bacterium]|jgi:cell division protein FtsN|nr:SPOR domain-containing protein [Alphaproteobacteria bacterium]